MTSFGFCSCSADVDQKLPFREIASITFEIANNVNGHLETDNGNLETVNGN